MTSQRTRETRIRESKIFEDRLNDLLERREITIPRFLSSIGMDAQTFRRRVRNQDKEPFTTADAVNICTTLHLTEQEIEDLFTAKLYSEEFREKLREISITLRGGKYEKFREYEEDPAIERRPGGVLKRTTMSSTNRETADFQST